jgi:hypothetical protein
MMVTDVSTPPLGGSEAVKKEKEKDCGDHFKIICFLSSPLPSRKIASREDDAKISVWR